MTLHPVDALQRCNDFKVVAAPERNAGALLAPLLFPSRTKKYHVNHSGFILPTTPKSSARPAELARFIASLIVLYYIMLANEHGNPNKKVPTDHRAFLISGAWLYEADTIYFSLKVSTRKLLPSVLNLIKPSWSVRKILVGKDSSRSKTSARGCPKLLP